MPKIQALPKKKKSLLSLSLNLLPPPPPLLLVLLLFPTLLFNVHGCLFVLLARQSEKGF